MRWVLGVLGVLCFIGGAAALPMVVSEALTDPSPPAVEVSAPAVCAAGATQTCVCATAQNGAQVCDDDGLKWGGCTCEAPPKPEPQGLGELRVRRLVLVDEKGRERAVLEMAPNLTSAAGKSDSDTKEREDRKGGEERIAAPASGLGPSLTLNDEAGKTLASLSAFGQDSSLSLLTSREGNGPWTWLSASELSGASVSLAGIEGRTSVMLTADAAPKLVMGRGAGGGMISLTAEGGSPSLQMTSPHLATSATLVSDDEGSGLLLSRGQASTIVAVADRTPSIQATDSKGVCRVSIGRTDLVTSEGPAKGTETTTPLSSIVLFGEDGKVTWRIP